MIERLIGTAIFIAFIALYSHVRKNGPDPYAQCTKLPTAVEQKTCRSQIDFAHSAGW